MVMVGLLDLGFTAQAEIKKAGIIKEIKQNANNFLIVWPPNNKGFLTGL